MFLLIIFSCVSVSSPPNGHPNTKNLSRIVIILAMYEIGGTFYIFYRYSVFRVYYICFGVGFVC